MQEDLKELVEKWRNYAQSIYDGFYDAPPHPESDQEGFDDWYADADEDELTEWREYQTIMECADELEEIINKSQ